MANNTTLTTINPSTALANKELGTAVAEIIKAKELGNKSAWIVACQYNKIIEDELFDDDFESLKDFADYMGVTKGLLSQYNNAVKFISTNTLGFNVNDLSVVRAYTLSTLDNLDEFVAWCESNDRDIKSMSDNGLKATIKEWKNELEAVDVESTEETPVEENDADVSRETMVNFELNGKKYSIPESVLASYELV